MVFPFAATTAKINLSFQQTQLVSGLCLQPLFHTPSSLSLSRQKKSACAILTSQLTPQRRPEWPKSMLQPCMAAPARTSSLPRGCCRHVPERSARRGMASESAPREGLCGAGLLPVAQMQRSHVRPVNLSLLSLSLSHTLALPLLPPLHPLPRHRQQGTRPAVALYSEERLQVNGEDPWSMVSLASPSNARVVCERERERDCPPARTRCARAVAACLALALLSPLPPLRARAGGCCAAASAAVEASAGATRGPSRSTCCPLWPKTQKKF